MKFKSL